MNFTSLSTRILLPAFLPANNAFLSVQPYEVCQKILAPQPYKATGPDNVPSRFLKDFAQQPECDTY
jgi:hypothetical protein